MWESVEFKKNQTPTFHLEDKVSFNFEGIVIPPIDIHMRGCVR